MIAKLRVVVGTRKS